MAGLYAPLPTLRRRPRGRLRTDRGRRGLLLPHRSGLSPHTPCQFPGALTCVTARPSLVPTLSSCRCLHEPKARFPVGRLVPLSGAGISPAGSIRLFLTHHIGDAVHPGSDGTECVPLPRRHVISARPCSTISECACHYSSQRRNAHGIAEYELLYPWHPWAGCLV